MIMRRLGLVASLALMPLFFISAAPLHYHFNHLARIAMLAIHGQYLDLAALHPVDWHIVPNLGMNALVPLLAQIMPPTLAHEVFLAIALIMPLLGTVALHDAIFEKRSWWALGSTFVVYNAALLAGFPNYTVALGLALLGAAACIRLRHRPRLQIAAGTMMAAALLLIDLLGAGSLS
jgi:hypothetical protein